MFQGKKDNFTVQFVIKTVCEVTDHSVHTYLLVFPVDNTVLKLYFAGKLGINGRCVESDTEYSVSILSAKLTAAFRKGLFSQIWDNHLTATVSSSFRRAKVN